MSTTDTIKSSKNFSGTVKECAAHWAENEEFDHIKVMSFVKVGETAVRQWFQKGVMPKGLNLLKLRVFLMDHGYIISECAELEPHVISLGKFIAHDKVDPEEATDIFRSIASQATLMRVILGQTNPSVALNGEIKSLVKEMNDWNESDDAVHNAGKSIDSDMLDAMVNAINHGIKSIKPFLVLFRDTLNEKDRKKLRMKINEDGSTALHDMSQLFAALCSKDAHEMVTKQKN